MLHQRKPLFSRLVRSSLTKYLTVLFFIPWMSTKSNVTFRYRGECDVSRVAREREAGRCNRKRKEKKSKKKKRAWNPQSYFVIHDNKKKKPVSVCSLCFADWWLAVVNKQWLHLELTRRKPNRWYLWNFSPARHVRTHASSLHVQAEYCRRRACTHAGRENRTREHRDEPVIKNGT